MPITFEQLQKGLQAMDQDTKAGVVKVDMLLLVAMYIKLNRALQKEHELHRAHGYGCLGPESETVFLELKEFVYGAKSSSKEKTQ